MGKDEIQKNIDKLLLQQKKAMEALKLNESVIDQAFAQQVAQSDQHTKTKISKMHQQFKGLIKDAYAGKDVSSKLEELKKAHNGNTSNK